MFKPVSVRALESYRLRVCFSDGVEGEVDLSHLAGQGVFQAWDGECPFESVAIGRNGELCWGEDLEICADVIYMKLTGKEDAFSKASTCVVNA